MTRPLFPTVPDPPQLVQGTASAPPGTHVLPDWQFDFRRGDFVVDSSGAVPRIERQDAVVAQQSLVTLLTVQAWYPIYTRRYGIDYERAMRRRRRAQTHADLEDQIRAQLRRLRGVADVVEFAWRDVLDQVFGELVVVTDLGARRRLPVAPPPSRRS